MKNKFLAFVIAAGILVLVTCVLAVFLLAPWKTSAAFSVQTPTIAPEIGIRASDPVTSVGLSQGQILAVDLEAPTTGYTWQVAFINPSVLEPVEDSALSPAARGSGAGAIKIMRFKAVGEGECELKLMYGRTFEKDEPLGRTFSVKVTVR